MFEEVAPALYWFTAYMAVCIFAAFFTVYVVPILVCTFVAAKLLTAFLGLFELLAATLAFYHF